MACSVTGRNSVRTIDLDVVALAGDAVGDYSTTVTSVIANRAPPCSLSPTLMVQP